MASPLPSLVRRAEQVLAELRAFNPDQERDERGRFAPGGGKSDPGGRPEALHEEATIRQVFSYEDPQTGLYTQVDAIRGQGPGFSTYVTVTIYDRDGRPVGQAERIIRPPDQRDVLHGGLILTEQMQGQGFATRYNAKLEESYREYGIETIHLNADLDVGGYAWARAGYDFASPLARQDVADRAREVGRRWNPDVQAEIARVAGNPNASPIEFAMIGHEPGLSTWPGKQIMLGANWDGVKELGPSGGHTQPPMFNVSPDQIEPPS